MGTGFWHGDVCIGRRHHHCGATGSAPGDWPGRLQAAVEAYNKRYHGTVHDSPNDVATGGIAHFMTLQDNAKKFAGNHRRTLRQLGRLAAAGNFREPIRGQAFAGPRRVAEPRFGPVVAAPRDQTRVLRGRGLLQIDGRRYLVKALQPVRMPAEV